MVRIVDIVQRLVLTVNGQRILGQIVCSDAEEIHLGSQHIRNHNGRRRLNHNAKLHIAEGNVRLGKLRLHFLHNALNLLYLIHRDNHWEHNGSRTVSTCPENGAELCLKYLRPLQTDTDGTKAHSRILFLGNIKVIGLLVGSDIQGTDNHLLAVHLGNDILIYGILLFLRRIIVSSQVQELASEKSDSLGIILQNGIHILLASDVGVKMHYLAALGHGGQPL